MCAMGALVDYMNALANAKGIKVGNTWQDQMCVYYEPGNEAKVEVIARVAPGGSVEWSSKAAQLFGKTEDPLRTEWQASRRRKPKA